jgi:hypothetical protein
VSRARPVEGESARGPVALGFRVRTGRATAVVLGGEASSPHLLARRELTLHDPQVPGSGQPFHAGLEAPPGEAEAVIRRATDAARKVALPAVREFVESARARSSRLRGAGIVGGSATDPAKIANAHMRAHALEGRLFPNLVAEGVAACGLDPRTFFEAEVERAAAKALRLPPARLRRILAEMGREAGPPWRALEKAAALAAWILLARSSGKG